jgi:hypothetical protein
MLAKITTRWADISVALESWSDSGAYDRAEVLIFCADVVSLCTRIALEGALGSQQSQSPLSILVTIMYLLVIL